MYVYVWESTCAVACCGDLWKILGSQFFPSTILVLGIDTGRLSQQQALLQAPVLVRATTTLMKHYDQKEVGE